ncbi:PREDICTED: 5'-adenylylsulfate reductase-like 4 [Tarenaya hassleriana]|uniref:5'-adenylylsulfate reductase-like 4 n=1 Tax=Tarenaya hassleriana TaxID=28532 RepID=UPI00053C6FB9|nr:PREDICTED: 5'-adenylylsulfate reductase-like 4 [Tarenaya hassleriana]
MEKRILLFVVVLGNLTCAAFSSSSSVDRFSFCSLVSAEDYILGFRDRYGSLSLDDGDELDEDPGFVSVTEGDERSLIIALDMIHTKECDYVALLFYASWCPFSRSFRLSLDALSSLYPSIPHFAIEDSTVRPSILSKYGVHGFPTLFLMNSTMRVRHRGSRSLGSLVAFYSDVTGIEKLDEASSVEENRLVPNLGNQSTTEQENCPFSWARSPENLLRQETYLALATVFVLLRLLHLVFPTLVVFVKFTWGRVAQNMSLESLSEHTVSYLSRVVRLRMQLKEPCKRSNLQEGAMNARAWASKSLATVSIGDSGSSSRGASASQ